MVVELYKVYNKNHEEIGHIELMSELEYFYKIGKILKQTNSIYLKFELYDYQSTVYRIKEKFLKQKQSKHDVKEINNLVGSLTDYNLRGLNRYIVGSESYALDLEIICEKIRKNNKR